MELRKSIDSTEHIRWPHHFSMQMRDSPKVPTSVQSIKIKERSLEKSKDIIKVSVADICSF